MTQEEIRGLLNQPYKTENWKKIAKDIFPDANIYSKPTELQLPDNKQIDIINTIGDVRLHSGEILQLYEVKVKPNVNIYRSRVALREALAKTIDYEKSNGVLVVYEQGRDDYRFTFAAKEVTIDPQTGQSVKKETDKKRFTYILGKNEKCRTAASRFFDIKKRQANGEEINLQSVIDAFNVGKLNDEFFADYRKIYGNFTKAITGYDEDQKGDGQLMQNFEQYFGGTDDLARKNARDFVKKMMGRIVFLYFVQKKGWLGVSAGKGWGEGDLNFIKHLFDATYDKNSFYKDVLEPLFYQNLNAARHNDIFDINMTLFNDGFADNIRIPYLNGGLFSDDMPTTNGFQFPGEEALFKSMFEFLEKYNFTIDENSDQEQTVAIDPEMLGRVFENLLEDNKEKGAFYTPREIVHYMCRQSLAEYLTTTLENKHSIKDPQLREKMENFVVNDDANEVRDWVQPLALALREVKVCDPAIGSGAFPMGMLREILEALNTLASIEEQTVREVWGIEGEYSDNYARIKEQIIQNSIYGVDIEKGAVDIARLRFWLSLIVDEHEPKPLPNLDYKIVVGNSLISMFNGTQLKIEWDLKALAGGTKLKKAIIDSINYLMVSQDEFFKSGNNNKAIAAEIRNAKIKVIINQLNYNKQKYISENVKEYKLKILTLTPEEKEKELYTTNKIASYDSIIAKFEDILSNKDEVLDYFDWKLCFPEIFLRSSVEENGFDLVIANPPYVNIANIEDKVYRLNIQNNYNTVKNKSDLYSVFIEKTHSLLKENGNACFIYPKTWMGSDSFTKFREFLVSKYLIYKIINLGYGVFRNATVSTIISVFSKKAVTENEIELYQSEKDNLNNTSFARLRNVLKYSQIKSTDKYLFSFLDQIKLNIDFVTLGSFMEFSLGIKTSDDKTFIIDYKKDDDAYLLLKGKNLKRYEHDNPSNYIWYKPKLMMKKVGAGPRNKNDFFKEKILIQAICNGNLKCAYDGEGLFVNDKIHIAFNSSKYSIKSILAILNSRLMSYISRSYFGDYLEIKINQLRELPFPASMSVEDENVLIELVNQRLSATNETDKLILEDKIDNIIFHIYKLNYNDVKLIYPDYNKSENEYNNNFIK
jgi:type I restriction-modification system DNA methylase subunit